MKMKMSIITELATPISHSSSSVSPVVLVKQGSYDDFHYLYWNMTGNATVTTKVVAFTGTTYDWKKGGIMFRGHLGERSPHSMAMVTNSRVANQWRSCEGCGSGSAHENYDVSGDVWLKMVKSGNTLTSYVKKGGEYGFMRFHEEEIDLGDDYHVGIAVTSHEVDVLGTLEVTDFEISTEVYTQGEVAVTEVGDTGRNILVQETAEGMWTMWGAGSGIGVSSFVLSSPPGCVPLSWDFHS